MTVLDEPDVRAAGGLAELGAAESGSAGFPGRALALAERIEIAPDGTSGRVDGQLVSAADHVELRKRLSAAVYAVLHAGLPADVENRVPYHGRDERLERRYAAAVPHQEVVEEFPVVGRSEHGVVVVREGLRVMAPADRVVQDDGPDTVLLRRNSCRPSLSPGFFLVDGSRPTGLRGPALRLYVRAATPEQAERSWGSGLRYLEHAAVGYRAKVLSVPVLFPRSDAVVFYLPGEVAAIDGVVAGLVAATDRPDHDPLENSFARPVTATVSLAWEPDDPRPEAVGLSFGQHRALVLTEAVLQVHRDGGNLVEALRGKLLEARVDVTDLARNVDSPPWPATGVPLL